MRFIPLSLSFGSKLKFKFVCARYLLLSPSLIHHPFRINFSCLLQCSYWISTSLVSDPSYIRLLICESAESNWKWTQTSVSVKQGSLRWVGVTTLLSAVVREVVCTTTVCLYYLEDILRHIYVHMYMYMYMYTRIKTISFHSWKLVKTQYRRNGRGEKENYSLFKKKKRTWIRLGSVV